MIRRKVIMNLEPIIMVPLHGAAPGNTILVHPASACLLVKKAFHTLKDPGGQQGPHLQNGPHPSPLPEGEGFRGLISPASLIEKRLDIFKKDTHLLDEPQFFER